MGLVIPKAWYCFYYVRINIFLIFFSQYSASLSFELYVGRSRYAEENQVIRAAGRKM